MSEDELGHELEEWVEMYLECEVCHQRSHGLDGHTAAEIGWTMRDGEPCCADCAKEK